MGRQRLAEVEVDELPEPCRSCIFWEAGGAPGAEQGPAARRTARTAKESWWRATSLEWGPCALGCWDDDHLLGYALVAPRSYLEGASRLGRVTDDALVLAVLWTDGDADVETVASWLVEAALRVVAARGSRALEAFASPNGQDSCLTSESLLQKCGFTLLRPQRPYPQYRLDLGQTARWKDSLEDALAGVRQLLRQRRVGRVPSMPSSARCDG